MPQWTGGTDAEPDDRERLTARWRRDFGLTAEQAERRWEEFLRCENYRDHLERQQPRPPAAEVEAKVREYGRKVIRER